MSDAKIVGKIELKPEDKREKPVLTAMPLKIKLGDFLKEPVKVKK